MRPLPLRWRVSLWIALAMTGVVIATILIAYGEMRELVLRQLDKSLLTTVRTTVSILDDGDQPAAIRPQLLKLTDSGLRTSPGFYRIRNEGETVDIHRGGLEDGDRQLAQDMRRVGLPPKGQPVYFDTQVGENRFRVVWMLSATRNGPVEIVIGRSTRSINTELRELLVTLTLMGSGVVAGSLVLVLLLVAWALRPLGTTARRLVDVTARNVGEVDLRNPRAPAELQPFVEAVSDMLDRLNKAMAKQKAFVSDASHELRTPLATAKSTVQLALNKDRDADVYKKSLQDTLSDLSRMERLTEELLTLARLDESSPTREMAEVELAVVLHEVSERLQPQAADGERIVCRLEPASVLGHEDQLTRLFTNLVDNAIKHGPQGGRVEVSLTHDDGWAVACVCDQGGAIPPEMLGRLFDRFFRVDPSRSCVTGGAGLGLAISKEIVLLHGGEISVTSEPREGTCFTVRLPRDNSPRSAQRTQR